MRQSVTAGPLNQADTDGENTTSFRNECGTKVMLWNKQRGVGECRTVMASASGAYFSILNSEIRKLIRFECEHRAVSWADFKRPFSQLTAPFPLHDLPFTAPLPLTRFNPLLSDFRSAHMLWVRDNSRLNLQTNSSKWTDLWVPYFTALPNPQLNSPDLHQS